MDLSRIMNPPSPEEHAPPSPSHAIRTTSPPLPSPKPEKKAPVKIADLTDDHESGKKPVLSFSKSTTIIPPVDIRANSILVVAMEAIAEVRHVQLYFASIRLLKPLTIICSGQSHVRVTKCDRCSWYVSLALRFATSNHVFVPQTGWSPEEAVGTPASLYCHPDDAPDLYRAYQYVSFLRGYINPLTILNREMISEDKAACLMYHRIPYKDTSKGHVLCSVVRYRALSSI